MFHSGNCGVSVKHEDPQKRSTDCIFVCSISSLLYIFLLCHNKRYPVIEDQVAVSESKLVATLVPSLM
jgi:hypothetical protein